MEAGREVEEGAAGGRGPTVDGEQDAAIEEAGPATEEGGEGWKEDIRAEREALGRRKIGDRKVDEEKEEDDDWERGEEENEAEELQAREGEDE